MYPWVPAYPYRSIYQVRDIAYVLCCLSKHTAVRRRHRHAGCFPPRAHGVCTERPLSRCNSLTRTNLCASCYSICLDKEQSCWEWCALGYRFEQAVRFHVLCKAFYVVVFLKGWQSMTFKATVNPWYAEVFLDFGLQATAPPNTDDSMNRILPGIWLSHGQQENASNTRMKT